MRFCLFTILDNEIRTNITSIYNSGQRNRSIIIITICGACPRRRLGVSVAGHVDEEADGSVALLAAHVALEDVVAAVVAHVDGIENGVLEVDITILALIDGRCAAVARARAGRGAGHGGGSRGGGSNCCRLHGGIAVAAGVGAVAGAGCSRAGTGIGLWHMAGLHRFICRAGARAGFIAELLVGTGAGNGRRGSGQRLELLFGCGHGSRLELQQCVQLEHTSLASGGTAAADQWRVVIL